MIPLYAPNISANEENVTLVKVCKENNTKCATGEVLCVLESTKSVFELTAESNGYVWIAAKEGAEVRSGDGLGWLSPGPFDPSNPPRLQNKDGSQLRLATSKKAQLLLEKHGISAEQVKPEGGQVREIDVLAFLRRTSTQEKQTDSSSHLFGGLDEIQKSWNTENGKLEDILHLKQVMALAQEIYAARWKRRIPVMDVLFDRWASAQKYGFGEGSNISHLSFVIGDVEVGRNTFIGPFTIIDGSGGLRIGDNCSIAAGVQIYSHDTIARALSGNQAAVVRTPTQVGNCCFIGPGTVITRGVTIGDHTFIGANSVVTTDIPPFTAAAGSPLRVIGRVDVTRGGKVQFRNPD